MENGNFLRKRQKRKNKNAIKRINKKHGKNMQNGAIKPQKREKKLQKANIQARNTGFCLNILKNRAETLKKSPGKSCTRLKLVKSGQKTLEYAQKCIIKPQSGLISI